MHGILDQALICHVGFVVDGHPRVIPTAHWRLDETLYLRGSAASRMLRALSEEIALSVAVTLVDGLVLARSAFHGSINYRSVVIHGIGRKVTDTAERLAEMRPPTKQELKATTVIAVPLTEVTAKLRTGPPVDDEEDYGLDVWAGVLPLATRAGAPLADPRLGPGTPEPAYLADFNRRFTAPDA